MGWWRFRDRTKPARRAGFTLIETTLSAAIFILLAGGIFTMMRDSQSIFRTSLQSVRARRACAQALNEIGLELELANAATLLIDTTRPEGDRIKFELPLAVGSGRVDWGARWDSAGRAQSRAGCFVEYSLAPAGVGSTRWQLVRSAVDAMGARLGPDVIVVDDLDSVDPQRGKGFTVTRTGHLVKVLVRVRLSNDDTLNAGPEMLRSQQITIRLRNQ